jgi:methanogenic corrinoid protein MtbC1
MATAFGLSELRSKLDDWRGSRKIQRVSDISETELAINKIRTVDTRNEIHDLSLLLENLVIPRLIADGAGQEFWEDFAAPDLSHTNVRATFERRSISDNDIEIFSRLSAHEEAHVLLAFIDEYLATGSSVESIFVELLAPAARRLGEYWDSDSEDFVGVTMGLWRIQEALRELTMRIPPVASPGHGMRSALFSPMPGEQHSFGTLMIAECFQRAGWETDVLIEPTQSELTGKIARQHYDLIGLTVSHDCSTGVLRGLVTAVKAVSSNPHLRVLLGGRVINEQPGLVTSSGADATAADALSAVALADTLVPFNVTCFEKLS